MRKHATMLFLGNHPKSGAECYELHLRLYECLSNLSGLQQPTHHETEPTKEILLKERVTTNRMELEINDFVRDIAMALTGKEIVFEETYYGRIK